MSTAKGPGVICIGMPKCGTTTLYSALQASPEFFVPPVKEIKYFAYDQFGFKPGIYSAVFGKHWMANQERQAAKEILKKLFAERTGKRDTLWLARFFLNRRDADWYLSLFPENQIGADISPAYHTLNADEIQRVKATVPDAKIVIMLRSPLQQMWSHCRMVVLRHRQSNQSADFIEHLHTQIGILGSYHSLVEKWRAEFGDKVGIFYMEDIITHPQKTLADIFRFIGAEDVSILDDLALERMNAGINFDVPDEVRPVLLDAARQRLEGFDKIDGARAAEWRKEIDTFAAG